MGMLRRPLPPPSPAASTTTALQALLTPEYDIIHVAGDVVAGFVGALRGVTCYMPLWFGSIVLYGLVSVGVSVVDRWINV